MSYSLALSPTRGLGDRRVHIKGAGFEEDRVGGERLAKERDARNYRDDFVLGAHRNIDTTETNIRLLYCIGFEVYLDRSGGLEGSATTWQDPVARNGGVFSYPVRLKRIPVRD